jgi:hypothetical protein
VVYLVLKRFSYYHSQERVTKIILKYIVFECGDFENDIEILSIEKEVIFRLHLHNNLDD